LYSETDCKFSQKSDKIERLTTKDNILFDRRHPGRLFPPQQEASELTVRCRRSDYSASLIARAVEDCDAHLLNLNVTALSGEEADDLVVDLRINHRNALSVARSLERYGYEVTDIAGLDPAVADTVSDRIGLILHNLEI